jgi:hypothetical protein
MNFDKWIDKFVVKNNIRLDDYIVTDEKKEIMIDDLIEEFKQAPTEVKRQVKTRFLIALIKNESIYDALNYLEKERAK